MHSHSPANNSDEAYIAVDSTSAELRIPLNADRCKLLMEIMESSKIPASFLAPWLAKPMLCNLDAFQKGTGDEAIELAVEYPEGWPETMALIETFNRKGYVPDWMSKKFTEELALDSQFPKETFESCGHRYYCTDGEAYLAAHAKSAH